MSPVSPRSYARLSQFHRLLSLILALVLLANMPIVPVASIAAQMSANGTQRDLATVASTATTDPCPPSTPSPAAPQLTYLGPTSGTYSHPLSLSAQLADGSGMPLAGRSLAFSLGSQTVSATTDANGVATAGGLPIGTVGPITAHVSFAGDSLASAALVTRTLTIARQETTLSYAGPLPGASAPQQQLIARLRDADTQQPIANALLQFSLGSASATATTDATGVATATLTFTIDDALSAAPLQISFAGDAFRSPAQLSVPASHTFPAVFGSVVVRHGPTVNGSDRIDGTLRVLTGEHMALNGGATITGDLLLPGTPAIVQNGSPTIGAIVVGSGSPQPSGYIVTLNGNVRIGRLVTRTDSIGMAAASGPPAPNGTRDVTLTSPGQSFGDPATLRNLTLNGNVGLVAVPPGTYGQFTANGQSALVFGVAGATGAAVYNLQDLTLNGQSHLRVVGPVLINLARGATLNGQTGAQAHPGWLTVNVAAGAVTVNGGSTVHGILRAPSSQVVLNGNSQLRGALFADRLTLNGGVVIVGLTAPNGGARLTAQQSSPASVLPGASFDTTLTVTNTGSVSATQVLAQERFTGTTPLSATATLGAISAASLVTTTFVVTAPALLARQVGETAQAYQSRLAARDGQRLRAEGAITYADVSGQAYPALHVSSVTTLRLPRLALGLAAPACVGPGSQIPYTVRASNLGSTPALGATARITFPDGSAEQVTLGTIAVGATTSATRTWTVPGIPLRQTDEPSEEDPAEGETSAAYRARLGAIDGTTLAAHATLEWQDARGSAYGSLEQQISTVERVPILVVTPQLPATLAPSQEALLYLSVQNIGSGNAASVSVQVDNPDTTQSSATGGALAAGATTVLQTNWTVPPVPPKGGVESDAAYQARLEVIDHQTLHFGILLGWTDAASNPYGLTSSTVQTSTPIPIVTVGLVGPSSADAGSTISYTVTLSNQGQTLAAVVDLELTMLDGTVQSVASGSLQPGETRQISVPFTIPATQPGGPATTTAHVSWQDSATNAYGPLSAQVTTTIRTNATPTPTVAPTATPAPSPLEGATLTLAPASAGPNVTGTQQQMTATLKDRFSAPMAGVSITFVVSGPNATSGSATTNVSGIATFTYTGANNGTDIVQATATSGGGSLTSNSASIGWVTPVQQISTSTIWGRFFTSNGSGSFNIPPSQTPAFEQTFPTINFNPPSGTVPGNTSGVGVNTRPFTNITTDLNGTYTGAIVAQGNGLQAGVGGLFDFQAVFTGQYVVAAPGNVTFNFYSDDGFIFGVGNGATRVSGANTNPPASGQTPFENLPVMGAYNVGTAPVGNSITVYFPAAGSYPYELDYSECCGGQLALTMTTATSSGDRGVPPSGTLTLSPNSVASKPTGQAQSFTATATDASGIALIGLPITFAISGPNGQQLSATTDAAGRASFSYSGANVGTDVVQAIAWVSGIAIYSAQVNVPWTAGTPPAPAAPLAMPGWVGSPTNQSSVSGQVPIRLASGITLQSGVVDYWPADDPSAVSVLASNVSGSGGATLATLDTTTLANGSYIIRLRGTNSSGVTVNSGVLITVVGEYKPGRVQFSVTDLTVPVTGLPITIGRTYDSLERSRSGDFGYGWSLSVGSSRLKVDPANNVTITQPNGQRVTFYFQPKSLGGFFGFLLQPAYTAESGVYGSLTADGCELMVSSGGRYICFLDDPNYHPNTYVYTDPYGRVFTMGADSSLRSIRDLNGNTLTFSVNGISSAGELSVPFVRDSQGRITQITDPNGNHYRYSYDATGNLASVMFPGVTNPITHSYDTSHLILNAVDARGNPALISTYYPDGRLERVTDALGNTTSYTYDLATKSTTTRHPDGGNTTTQYDSYGMTIRETDPLNRTTTFAYDPAHNLLSQTDALSNTTSYTYDSTGNKTSLTDPLGKTWRSTFNQFGSMTSDVDPLGNTRMVSYDANFLFTGITDTLGALGAFTWDSHGAMLSRSLNAQGTISYTYDIYGNMLSETNALGQRTSYTYDALGRQLTRTDAASHTWHSSYDALGHLLVLTDPLGQTTRYEYDANGNQIAQIDTAGRRASSAYDAANRLTQLTYPDNTTVSYTYDFRGNPITETDQAGHMTRYQYDLAGQLVSSTYVVGTAAESTTRFGYDAAGRRISETDELGHTTTYIYDRADHVIQATDPLGHSTSYTYDDWGHRVTMTDANGHVTRYSHDARGRETIATYPDGTTSRQSYDALGNLVSKTDQAGEVTRYGYDGANRLVSVTDALNQAITYTYDATGNLLTITDANGHITSFAYDPLSHQTRKTWPDGSFEAYGYDAVGNQVRHQLADGQLNTYRYDLMDHLTQVNFFDGRTLAYTYTTNGLRATATDSRGVTRYNYDSRDRLVELSHPDSQRIVYTYDQAGNRRTLTTAAGTISYSYDAANRLTSVRDPQGQETTYTYNNLGLRTRLALPNGITASYDYDLLNRLTALVQRDTQQQVLASYVYTLGPAGNRQRVVEADGAVTQWSYDDAYRLTSETMQQGSTTATTNYTYDPAGNRLTMTINGQTTNYRYNERDQLLSAGTTQYRYDQRGNLTQISDGTTVTDLSYNAADQVVTASVPDGTHVVYAYDADGYRVRQTVGVASTNYVWDQTSRYGNVVLETDDGGAVQASYVLGEELIAQNRGGAVSYYLPDGLSSVRALADDAGALTDRYRYDAYGVLRERQGTTQNAYQYRGQQTDSATGLIYLRARYYNPADGRFLTADVADIPLQSPVDLNRYSYTHNDPINHYDPSGYLSGSWPEPDIKSPPKVEPKKGGGGGPAAEYAALVREIALALIPAVSLLGQTVKCQYEYIWSVLMTANKDVPGLRMLEASTNSDCILPILHYPGETGDRVSEHMQYAQDTGQPMLLTYTGPLGKDGHNENRKLACNYQEKKLIKALTANRSCDEYPFASTLHGGYGASTAAVPISNNNRQGGILSNFYQRTQWRRPDKEFAIIVEPWPSSYPKPWERYPN